MSEGGFRRHKANLTTRLGLASAAPGPRGAHRAGGSQEQPRGGRLPGPRRDRQGARAPGPGGDAPASFPGHCPTCPEGQDAACSLHSGARSGRRSGTTPIARWSRGERERERASGAGSRRPHLAVPFQAPEGRPAHTGPARGAPSPRRNHGFARRPQSGADAEAILCGGAGPGRGARRWLHRAPVPRRPPRELRAEAVGSPAYPHAGPGLVASPPPPRPARIRLRSDTSSPRPTPGHVSRAPGGPRSLGQTKGPRDAAGPGPGAPGDRAKGGGGGHKAAFVAPRPARGGGGLNRPRPPAAQARPHRARRPGLGRTRKPVPSAANRPPPPQSPQPATTTGRS